MTLFSIIIPLYNAEKYISRCLDSIARQTFRDFEVIIIDDGSKDNGAALCKEMALKDSRFTYYFKEHGGVSNARNAGLEIAVGEWISFIDADDYVSPDYLQSFVDIEPKADVTFFGEKSIRKGEVIESKVPAAGYYEGRKEIEEAIYSLKCGALGDVFGWTWDKIFRASIIREHNVCFAEEVSFREDELFAFEYCRYVSTLRTIDKPLYYYRIMDSGLTRTGMRHRDLLPASKCLEESMQYYSNPMLREKMLKSITDYRAMDIYGSSMEHLPEKLKGYIELIQRHPQPGVACKVNNLTRYLRKSYFMGLMYCLVRKI